jgi:hypothetical protein
MIALLFLPLGRYLVIGGLIAMVLGGIYFKIRSDAVAEIEAAATVDALRRMEDAVRAGDAIDLSPDRVRDPDRNNRD